MTELMRVERTKLDIDKLIAGNHLPVSYKYDAQEFLGFMDSRGVPTGDSVGWAAYQRSLEGRHLEAATFNHKIAAAKRILRFLFALKAPSPEQQARFELALQAFKPKPVNKKREIETVTKEQVQAMIAAALEPTWGLARNRARPDLALMIEFLYRTGVRVSEMINVRLSDIKPAGKAQVVIHLKVTKGGKPRPTRALPKDLIDRIRRHFRGEVYLFESPNGGKGCRAGGERDARYTRECISTLIHRVALQVLGEGFGAHRLRHSFATACLQGGNDIYSVSKLLGHSRVETTIRYLHPKVDQERVAAAVDF